MMKTTVADVMNADLLYLANGTRTELAKKPILRFGVTAVPMLDDEGRPVGIVSFRDLLGSEGPVEPTRPVFSVVSTTPVDEAARSLAETDYHHLVVVNEATGRAVGMVSAVDLLRALVGMPARHPVAFPTSGRAPSEALNVARPVLKGSP
jgi:CBS domain-containing protein